MDNKIEVVLNYDFDPEEGYTQKSIELDNNEWAIYEDALHNERKLIVHLYENDLRELLKGTGIELDGN